MLEKIISGGQTGVDRAALDAALKRGIPCGGWCPRGRLAEDGRIPDRYPLIETTTDQSRQRTEWNVRDTEGTLRAFYNVCRHRGGPLALEDGCARMLTCKYHGWVYRLDGTLRGVPHWDRVELFDPGEFGLRPVHVDAHDGLVFVHLGDAPVPLADWVGPLPERMPVALAGFQFAHRATYDVACNWKVYVDNFLEGYHIPHVHPELTENPA